MAEMTASEAIRILTELAHHLTQVKRGGSSLDLGEIAALIQQQAQTIEKLKLCWNCKYIEADRCNKHNRLIDFPTREECADWQVKEGQ